MQNWDVESKVAASQKSKQLTNMIDDVDKTQKLIAEMDAYLPFTARLSQSLKGMIRRQVETFVGQRVVQNTILIGAALLQTQLLLQIAELKGRQPQQHTQKSLMHLILILTTMVQLV